MKNLFPHAFFALLTAIPAAAMAAPEVQTRQYRPLVAKTVRIQPSGLVRKDGAKDGPNGEGWRHFDRQEWEPAMDAFLTALERDPRDASAAEGLTMAVFRSGDSRSAAELAEEFSPVMPWIRGMVAQAALAGVRAELERGDLVAAEALVRDLPWGAGAYDESRQLLEAAQEEAAETPERAVAAAGN